MLNLTHLTKSLAAYGPQYNKKKFAACIIRLKNGDLKAALLLFSKGKVVCTGAKDEIQAAYLSQETVRILSKAGIKAVIRDLKIQNMVVSVTLPWKVNQSRLAEDLSWYCTYDPNIFPGITIRHEELTPITALLFESVSTVSFINLKRRVVWYLRD